MVSDQYSVSNSISQLYLKLTSAARCPLLCPDLAPREGEKGKVGREEDPPAADSSGDPRLPSPLGADGS